MSSAATTERQPELAALVIGLGNPILGDDGVGWAVVDALEDRLARDATARRAAGPVELDRLAVGGLRLMERLADRDRAILVDAVLGSEPVGAVTVAPLTSALCRQAGHLDSAHDAPLVEALAAGRTLGARLPDEILVVGIAVERVDEFRDGLSPAVHAAVEPAVRAILAYLASASREPAPVGVA